ncbi:TATA box-binding protein-associated factor RNA polymerase I subunit C [Coemansia guatemalensis]|uniref:TATA box-binding protein-associated factor RNA polymerase I subunit C n=1 Tax=Coemansia guatemalensis TaxID=2761395 RepID=A0A9W8HZH2_9FUNG|nr:TATA box-binding protein-associated factor RNA polymerase I subunit C [Coemansia guatemalensis]
MEGGTSRISKAFPAAAWPLNRREAGVGHAALAPTYLGIVGCAFPVLRPSKQGRLLGSDIHWHPASMRADTHTHSTLYEPRAPVMLRPPTRAPGFMQNSKNLLYQDMVSHFRSIHADLDISHGIIAGEFRDAMDDASRDVMAFTKGNTVACCRPALDEELIPHTTPSGIEAGMLPKEIISAARRQQEIWLHFGGRDHGNGDDVLEAPRWSSHREWALYAGGECNSELWSLPLPSREDMASEFPSLRSRAGADPRQYGMEAEPSMEFSTPIRQILACDEHPGFVCVRTDSMVGIISVAQCHRGIEWTPYIRANIVGEPYAYDSGDNWTCHAAWSRWNISELALASGTGAIRLWDCNAGSATTLKDDKWPSARYDIQWNSCEYWGSPRHILCGNGDALYYLDARTKLKNTTIMSLDQSPFAFDSETFTAISTSALHPLHAVAASTHAIRVFDQRYLKQPVVAWEHGFSKSDPPTFLQTTLLPNYAEGRAACIFAAAEESSRVYGYIYGQTASDQPYTSLDQVALTSTTAASMACEDIQDTLAIDSYDNQDTIVGNTHITDYPTACLTGVLFRFLPSGTAETTGPDSMHTVMDAVCVCVNELGAVTGNHIVVGTGDSNNAPFGVPDSTYGEVLGSAVWRNARGLGNATIDGMNILFQSNESRVHKREYMWTELGKRSEVCRFVDMTKVYKVLVDSLDKQTNKDSDNIQLPSSQQVEQELEQRLDSVSAKDISAYQVLSAASFGLLQNDGGSLVKRPTQPVDDIWLRRQFLSMHAAGSDTANSSARQGAPENATARALESLFSCNSSQHSAHMCAALHRAAEDVELATIRLRRFSPKEAVHADSAETLCMSCTMAGPEALCTELDSSTGGLSDVAQLLDRLWAGDSAAADDLAARQHPISENSSRPSRAYAKRASASQISAVQTQPPPSPAQTPGAAMGISTAPPATHDMFTFASTQQSVGLPARPHAHRHSTNGQTKKKKARKLGF